MKAIREATSVERRARAMHGRVAAAWAMDMFALRAAGLDRPGFRKARRLLATPAFLWCEKGEAA